MMRIGTLLRIKCKLFLGNRGFNDRPLAGSPIWVWCEGHGIKCVTMSHYASIAGQFCVKVLLKIFPRGQWSGIGIILELCLGRKCNWGVVIDHWSIIIRPTIHISNSNTWGSGSRPDTQEWSMNCFYLILSETNFDSPNTIHDSNTWFTKYWLCVVMKVDQTNKHGLI